MASKPYSFSRASRLLSPEQFTAALKARPLARSVLFMCHWCESIQSDVQDQDQTQEQAKLGFIIPKRLVRLSVRRNTIKRVLRESFRQHQHSLPSGYYVFRLKAAPAQGSLTDLKHLVREQTDSMLAKVSSKK